MAAGDHSKPEVNLRSASFENFEAFSDMYKNTQWGNFVIFRNLHTIPSAFTFNAPINVFPHHPPRDYMGL